jgi:hypothetical protein
MLPENVIENKIIHHNITQLSPGVKQFYNGPCARINIENSEPLTEVIDLLELALSSK